MKYIKKFNTQDDVLTTVLPNVCLVADTKEILFNVEPLRGVFIQHIAGILYTTDGWTGGGFTNDQANGIAVVADEASFVIAKDKVSTSMPWSSNTSTLVDGIVTSTDSTVAKTDFAGQANTELMLATDKSGAGYSCANFTFPNGEKGYLPALGEWSIALANKTAIDEAMALIGGTALSSNDCWSSSQSSATTAWRLGWTNGYTYNSLKTSNCPVRAFSALPSTLKVAKLITFTIAGTKYSAINGMTWEEWVNTGFNTSGFIIDSLAVRPPNSHNMVSYTNDDPCNRYDKITDGYAYKYTQGINIEA